MRDKGFKSIILKPTIMYEYIESIQTQLTGMYGLLAIMALAWTAGVILAFFSKKKTCAIKSARLLQFSEMIKLKTASYNALLKEVKELRSVIEDITSSDFYSLRSENKRLLGNPTCNKCEKRAAYVQEYLNKTVLICESHFQLLKKDKDVVYNKTPSGMTESLTKKDTQRKIF